MLHWWQHQYLHFQGEAAALTIIQDDLLFYLLTNAGLLLLAATMLTELRPLRTALKQQDRSVPNQLLLGLIFGLLSIASTYTGLNFQGAIVNTRTISTLAAGLVGGPLTGVSAGVLSGLHRYCYAPGGFTALSCGLGTASFGVLGAVCHRWFSVLTARRNWALVGLTLAAELLQCALILALSRPFEAAVALEKAILLPKIVVNSLGLVAFMATLDRLNRSLTIELVEQQAMALFIAQTCLPYLREGLGSRSALRQAVEIVRGKLSAVQVAITDLEEVLAASGGELTGQPLPPFARQAAEEKRPVVIQDGSWPLRPSGAASIAAPLVWDERAVGTLILAVRLGPNLILEAERRTAESLAQLFSSMLELGELQHQVELRQQAELRALQSQINPHFLFNALNTISALCLTDPNRARETILVLANYFRQTLSINEPFVTLEQELDNVDNYLFLTEARFEDAIHVTKELPGDLTRLRLPPLILQPIVENAVRHGGVAVDDRRVHIQIQQDEERAYIQVSDQGKGFPTQVLEKLQDPDDPSYTGLFNVRKRLRSIYGDHCPFSIQSTPSGSTVSFSLPLSPPARTGISMQRSDVPCASP